MKIVTIILYIFALTGIGFAIYQSIGLIKTKRDQDKRIKEFDQTCKDFKETFEKYKYKDE